MSKLIIAAKTLVALNCLPQFNAPIDNYGTITLAVFHSVPKDKVEKLQREAQEKLDDAKKIVDEISHEQKCQLAAEEFKLAVGEEK